MKLSVVLYPIFTLLLLSAGFYLGRSSVPQVSTVSVESFAQIQLIQDNDPRELQPFPGPGQGFGLPQGSEECPLYFFQDGQLFQMDPEQGLPGQEGSPELFPLQPLPGAPGQPTAPPPPALPELFSEHAEPQLATVKN